MSQAFNILTLMFLVHRKQSEAAAMTRWAVRIARATDISSSNDALYLLTQKANS